MYSILNFMSRHKWLYYVIIAICVIIGAHGLVKMQAECNARGGELIENYAGMLVCVEVKK